MRAQAPRCRATLADPRAQSVLATFRSQRVSHMTFELTPDAKLVVALDCDNGAWGWGRAGGSSSVPRRCRWWSASGLCPCMGPWPG